MWKRFKRWLCSQEIAEALTEVRTINAQIDDGKYELTAEMKSLAMPIVSQLLVDILKTGRTDGTLHNYAEWQVTPPGMSCGPLVCSVTRVHGDTPAQQIRRLEECLIVAARALNSAPRFEFENSSSHRVAAECNRVLASVKARDVILQDS